jgi:hypothetical protein
MYGFPAGPDANVWNSVQARVLAAQAAGAAGMNALWLPGILFAMYQSTITFFALRWIKSIVWSEHTVATKEVLEVVFLSSQLSAVVLCFGDAVEISRLVYYQYWANATNNSTLPVELSVDHRIRYNEAALPHIEPGAVGVLRGFILSTVYHWLRLAIKFGFLPEPLKSAEMLVALILLVPVSILGSWEMWTVYFPRGVYFMAWVNLRPYRDAWVRVQLLWACFTHGPL